MRSRAVSGRRSTTSGSLRASTRRTRLPGSKRPSSRAGSRLSRSSRSSTTPTAANLTFNRLIQGFLGLGLIVGVAALGVISARAVVERRQQIGVMRAIGFRTRHGASRLPARVLVRRADLDPGRHRARPAPRVEHHPRPAVAAELGEPRACRALAEPRASSSSLSTPSPSRRPSRLRSARRRSGPQKRCDTSSPRTRSGVRSFPRLNRHRR